MPGTFFRSGTRLWPESGANRVCIYNLLIWSGRTGALARATTGGGRVGPPAKGSAGGRHGAAAGSRARTIRHLELREERGGPLARVEGVDALDDGAVGADDDRHARGLVAAVWKSKFYGAFC